MQNILGEWNSGKVMIVTGPRQVGKKTLLREICSSEGEYLFINGDDPEQRLLLENAGESKLRTIIGSYKTVFIDEAQRIPDIGLTLKIVHDRIPEVRVLVSGSSSLDLASGINEPLTGRKWELNLFPLSWKELIDHFGYLHVKGNLPNYLVYGMYPEVITNPIQAERTLRQIAGSYLYKDILNYKGIRKPEVLDKLLLALALQIGSEVNYNELSKTVGIDRATIEQYINLLEKTYVIFRVNPLSRNSRIELNTMRKIYFYDNGIRNTIIGAFQPVNLRTDIGALWENFVISERIKKQHYNDWYGRNYFWRTYQQQEIDWVEEIDARFSAFEFKWNPRKINSKISKTFLKNYEIHETGTITPDNVHEFLT